MVEHMKMDCIIARCFELVEKAKGKREIALCNLCRYAEETTKQMKELYHKNIMININYDSLVEFIHQNHSILQIEEVSAGNVLLKIKPGVMAVMLKYEWHCQEEVAMLQRMEKSFTVKTLIAS